MPSFLNGNACKTSVEVFVKESLQLSEDLFNLEDVYYIYQLYDINPNLLYSLSYPASTISLCHLANDENLTLTPYPRSPTWILKSLHRQWTSRLSKQPTTLSSCKLFTNGPLRSKR